LPAARLVITEGSYLLLDDPMWVRARRAMDAVWFVAGDERVRVQRLVDRHVESGKTPPAAREWVAAIDQPNADAVSTTAVKADRIIVNDAAGPFVSE
jgi:pantothenate kinase